MATVPPKMVSGMIRPLHFVLEGVVSSQIFAFNVSKYMVRIMLSEDSH